MRAHAESYLDAEKRPYIHLVDGKVLNDNLGIRRLLDRLVASGSLSAPFRDAAPGSICQVVLIAVNSERDLGERIDNSDRVPRTRQVVDTLLFGAGGQITQVTLAIMSDDRERWRRELAEQRGTLGSPFAADADRHVITVGLHDVEDPTLRRSTHRSDGLHHRPRPGTSLGRGRTPGAAPLCRIPTVAPQLGGELESDTSPAR